MKHKHILLVGAGKVGAMITELLATSGDYHVTVADAYDEALAKVIDHERVDRLKLNVENADDFAVALKDKFAVLSAVPFYATKFIAEAAVKAQVHYFDLTEDVLTTQYVKKLSQKAQSVLMPQCGLAPGFITIAAYHLAQKFDELDRLRMRVGALSEFPTNGLKYNLTWSTAGIINEYIQPCEAIVDGRIQEVAPLEGLEKFSLDGIDYEAFNTSGGLGTLCETLEGKVKDLNYKSVRYPGHCESLRLLLHDLKLRERPDVMIDLFENALPITYQDVVLIFVTATGKMNGALTQETFAQKVYSQKIGQNEQRWSALQITTAASICAVLDLVAEGRLPQKGFLRQEDVDFQDFITNRFGKYYAQENTRNA